MATPQTSRANTPRPGYIHELENAKGTFKASGMLNLYVYDWLRLQTSSMRLHETDAEHRAWIQGHNPNTPSPREKRFILKSGLLMELLENFDAKASASIDQWLVSVSKEQSSHLMFLPGFAKTQEGMNMRKAKWWPNCFGRNGLCICGFEFGMNYDEKVFRYEPQLPKDCDTVDKMHIWKDRMRQWCEIIEMEKEHQFQFHSETNSPLKVVDWEYPKCWEDEPIIVWLKKSNYIRKKSPPQFPQPPQAPMQGNMWQSVFPVPCVMQFYPCWFHYPQYTGW